MMAYEQGKTRSLGARVSEKLSSSQVPHLYSVMHRLLANAIIAKRKRRRIMRFRVENFKYSLILFYHESMFKLCN